MKKITISFLLITTVLAGNSQNLVPNASFENYSSCPTATSQMYLAVPWTTPSTNVFGVSGTPDFFHQCSPGAGVPSNPWGYEYAHTGNGYAHCVLYESPLNAKEYIEVQLTSPLIAGACYYFEMYASIADDCKFSTDAMGVYFSNTLISGVSNWLPLPYTPQINNTIGNFPDTSGWTLVSGNYTALGGESYIIIGNFEYDTNTPLSVVNNSGFDWAYAYFDDILLTVCTGTEEQNKSDLIKIYPNPVKDWINVQIPNSNFQNKEVEIKITDILGKQVYINQFPNSSFQIPTSDFQTGIYFLEINDGKNSYEKKFLKK